MPIDITTIVKQAQGQLSCQLNNEVAILDLKSTLYFGLDNVGAFIWQKIEEPQAVTEIFHAVMEYYNVDEPRCRTDVLEFLNRLDELGLIESDIEHSCRCSSETPKAH